MMLQQRIPGPDGSVRLYNPDRDLAYSFRSIAQAAMNNLEGLHARPWLKGYLDHHGVTTDDLNAAAEAYAKYYGCCHLAEVDSPKDALERAGWFANVKPEAQAALCMAMGQAVTCAYFTAIRDVTFDDKPPVDPDALYSAARKARDQMCPPGRLARLWARVKRIVWRRTDPARPGTPAP